MRISCGAIALVDDDAYVLSALRRAMVSHGFRVKPFASAEQYLEEADEAGISCAVIDIELGRGLSGLDLGDAIACSPRPLPIVFMSGSNDPAIRRRAREIGCVAFLDKPFLVSALLSEIAKLDGNAQ